MDINFRQLGKEATKRITARTKTLKVNGTANAVRTALHADAPDARQLPWSYGEKRNRPVDGAGNLQG